MKRSRDLTPIELARPVPVWLVVALSAPLIAIQPCAAAEDFDARYTGFLELDVKSDYSHIRVRKKNNVRSLTFVHDSGKEALETQLDLTKPHELRIPYLGYMFLSYVFQPEQEKVLIVGLGGGAMIHFLRRYDPDIQIDAVEIDPVVVRIAKDYFGIRSEGNVQIITADASAYLVESQSRYDVIYMDAFLKPSRETDSTGVPLALRTQRFYQAVQQRLKPGGLVVFHLNAHPDIQKDVHEVRDAFPQIYTFPLPWSGGLAVMASMSPEREPLSAITEKAKQLDRRFEASFSFQPMVRRVGR